MVDKDLPERGGIFPPHNATHPQKETPALSARVLLLAAELWLQAVTAGPSSAPMGWCRRYLAGEEHTRVLSLLALLPQELDTAHQTLPFSLDKCAAIVSPAKGAILSSASKPVSRCNCLHLPCFQELSFVPVVQVRVTEV